jgi:glycosyltransferase involved in cell wall biosynthesis
MNLSGGTRVVLMIAEHLRRRGHQPFVIAPPPPQPGLKARIRALLKGEGWLRGERPDLAYVQELGLQVEYRLLDRHRPVEDRDLPDADVVVATWWLTAEWVSRLSPSKGARAYFLQQLESNFGMPADRVDATWRLPMQKIVCARWLADLAREQFGDPSAIVVPNGIDTELFHAPRRSKQQRPTVGFLYAPNVPLKATGTALTAMAAAARQVPGLLVRSFGTQELHPAAPLPPDAHYTCCPAQVALPSIYAACDVWLCSSTSEGFHLPPHEAMACRCPVVSTRVGGPTDLVLDGVNGYLVDVGDTAGLADRLVKVLSAEATEWQRMSDAAHDTAQRFTWREAAELYERALEITIARFGKHRPGAAAGRRDHALASIGPAEPNGHSRAASES